MTMAQKIGDELVSNRRYQELYRLWREARTPTRFMDWAKHYLSPAGARDRELVRHRERYEAQTKAQTWDGIRAQRAAMDAEVDPIQDPEVVQLRRQANERDETGGYSLDALKAQRQLRARGIAPTPART
jgi:hypothetical protein